MAFAMKDVTLRGIPVRYHVSGEGPPVLYCHSGGGFIASQALDRLAGSFRIYAPVVPGFDGTPMADALGSMADVAALWADFVTSVTGAEKVDVVGYSFGGLLATWLAATQAAKVYSLVLQGPAGFRPEGSAAAMPTDPAERARMFYKYPERMPPGDAPGERYARSRAAATRYMKHPDTDFDLLPKLDALEAPTLVLLGTEERVVPPAAGHLLKSRLKRCQLVYVYDAGHGMEVDQPERTATLIRDFFVRGDGFIVNWGHTPRRDATL